MRARMVLGGRRYGLGGAQRIVEGLEHRLEREGWEVEWLTPHDLPAAPVSQRFPAVNEALRALWLSRALRRMPRVDLTVSHGVFGMRTPGRRIHAYHGTSAGMARACRKGVHPLDYLVTRWLYGGCEQWSGVGAYRVAVSQRVAREVGRFYRLRTQRLLHNGVDTRHFTPRPDASALRRRWSLPEDVFLLLVVGRMDYGKGREVLKAMAPLLPPQTKFVVAAPESSKMDTLPAERLILLPGVAYEELPRLYGACDALLCASLYEGFGLTLIEAWACGLPVVTGRLGIIEELAGSEPALDACVAEVGDASRLAAAVGRLVEDRDLGRRQGEWGRALVEDRFSAERFTSEWWRVIQEVSA